MSWRKQSQLDPSSTTAHPDGSPRRWPDGAARSWNNGFTHGLGAAPHGYKRGTAVAPSPARDKRTSRSAVAFGRLNGTYESTPATSSATIPPRRAGHLHRKPA